MRAYFVTAVDEESGLPVLFREITASTFTDAGTVAEVLAEQMNEGKPVRVTGVTEQPNPSESHYRKMLRRNVEAALA